MKGPRRLWLAAGALAAAVVFQGCRDDGGGGSLVIVSGVGGGTAPTGSGGTTTTTPGSFSLVKSDAGGGTIVESADGKLRKIAGVFHESVTLEARYEWVIDAPVFVGADDASKSNTITIEAGTTLKGRGGTPPSMLVIRRGAKLLAEGTPTSPIVFTSAQPAGSRAPGDWGGLIINGQAPVNDIGPGGELPFGEGGSGRYGGTNPDDSSGTLRYVRVEFAGHVFTSDDELNGIAFQGVGRGTTVDFVQVHRNADDGVEFFGGTVSIKHLLVTGCQDDSLDWTSGWQGKVQFAVLQQWEGGADNGIEADNLEAKNDATPRSKPLISNLTVIGPKATSALSGTGLVLRRGTGARIWNSIVLGMNQYGLDVDSNATWNHAYADAPGSYNTLSNELTVESSFFFGNALGNFRDDAGEPQTDTTFNGHQANANALVDPQLTDPQNQAAPDFRPKASSPALAGWISPGDPFFATATFRGAMDATTNWAAGWSTAAAN